MTDSTHERITEADYWAQLFGNDTLIDYDADLTPNDELYIDETIGSLRDEVRGYEQKYGMTSAEFLRQWRLGLIEDTYETNVWAMLADLF